MRWIAALGAALAGGVAVIAALCRRSGSLARAELQRDGAVESLNRVAAGQQAALEASDRQAEGQAPEADVVSRDAAWGRQ